MLTATIGVDMRAGEGEEVGGVVVTAGAATGCRPSVGRVGAAARRAGEEAGADARGSPTSSFTWGGPMSRQARHGIVAGEGSSERGLVCVSICVRAIGRRVRTSTAAAAAAGAVPARFGGRRRWEEILGIMYAVCGGDRSSRAGGLRVYGMSLCLSRMGGRKRREGPGWRDKERDGRNNEKEED